ncbi:MAG: hypothetical protein WBQ14_10710 [Gaiellaceae bacterium]
MRLIARFASRRLVLGALLAVAGSLLLGACGAGDGRVYRDETSGARLDYPVGFRALSFFAYSGPGRGGRGVIVVNNPGRAVLSSGSSKGLFVWAELRPDAVAFVLRSGALAPAPRNYGPPLKFLFPVPGLSAASEVTARLPLKLALFRSLEGESFMNSACWQALGLQVKGRIFAADVYVGPRASKADRVAIWRVVSSLRFPK